MKYDDFIEALCAAGWTASCDAQHTRVGRLWERLEENKHYDLVKKLIGPINPVGETNTDNNRYENLKKMIGLVDKLLGDIDEVATRNENAHEFSRKRAAEFASKFFKRLGIEE